MKIVIDIPDKIYNAFHKGNWSATYDGKKIRDIVMRGTLLPKGHGDIVDIETLIDMFWDGNSMEITKYDLSVIEPIIEADKAERGNKE